MVCNIPATTRAVQFEQPLLFIVIICILGIICADILKLTSFNTVS